jgi:hypothetical protein
MNSELKKFLQKPVTGSALTAAAGVSFFFTLMLLPLVGRAGSSSPNADKNQLGFLAVLGLTFILAVLATWVKMLRRSGDKSPIPYWSLALCVLCAALCVLLLTGLLAV